MFQKCMQTFLYSFETNAATHFRLKIDITTCVERLTMLENAASTGKNQKMKKLRTESYPEQIRYFLLNCKGHITKVMLDFTIIKQFSVLHFEILQ